MDSTPASSPTSLRHEAEDALRALVGRGDARLRELIGRPLTDPDELAEALALMRAHPALEAARTEVQRRAEAAKERLVRLPDSPARDALHELCDRIVSRSS